LLEAMSLKIALSPFFRTHLSAYFIKRVAITDKQASEHLDQAQRENVEEEIKQEHRLLGNTT
jgi:hypothetical protein